MGNRQRHQGDRVNTNVSIVLSIQKKYPPPPQKKSFSP